LSVRTIDRQVATLETDNLSMLALFAIWVLLSGLDDFFLDLACLCRWFVTVRLGRCPMPAPSEADLADAPRKRIAVFVPAWREHNVIRKMIEHNLASHGYERCDFFVGVYPDYIDIKTHVPHPKSIVPWLIKNKEHAATRS